MDKVRIGVLGVGNMGTGHCRNLLAGKCPEIELTAVADINADRRAFAKENYPESVAVFDDGIKMMDSGKIDAIIIAVPHYFHPEYVIAALERGIHAMSEKPAGVYTKQVREMNEVAAKSNAIFAMMFNQRTDHIYRKMREIVQSGELGAIRRTSLIITNWYRTQAYYDSGAWRATWAGEGGGVLLNQCPHNIDYWQWICGMPSKVRANLSYGKWHDIEVEDDVTVYVEYPNGATGTFITTTGDYAGTNRFEINFDQGKLISENGKLYMWKGSIPEQVWSKECPQGYTPPELEYCEVETDGKSMQHVGVLNAFAGAILRGEPLVARGEEGINGLTLSNAMHLSSWLGCDVEIPFDEDLYYEELKKRIATSRLKDPSIPAVVVNLDKSYNTQ